MKRKIDIDQLQVGMFMEADVREAAEKKLTGSAKNVLLLGKGVLITSENQIRRLVDAGLDQVTIDTTKGKDIEGGEAVPTLAVPPERRERKTQKLPEGRTVSYRDEIKVARKIRGASVQIVKEFMGNASTGASIDTSKRTTHWGV